MRPLKEVLFIKYPINNKQHVSKYKQLEIK